MPTPSRQRPIITTTRSKVMHGGSYARYGTGKGTFFSIPPRVRGLGQPNTTNTIHVEVSRGLGGAAAVLVWGARASIRLPFGVMYATPVIAVPIRLAGIGTTAGHFTFNIALPNNPAWKGAAVAVQGWVLDRRALHGVTHTGGLAITIGH